MLQNSNKKHHTKTSQKTVETTVYPQFFQSISPRNRYIRIMLISLCIFLFQALRLKVECPFMSHPGAFIILLQHCSLVILVDETRILVFSSIHWMIMVLAKFEGKVSALSFSWHFVSGHHQRILYQYWCYRCYSLGHSSCQSWWLVWHNNWHLHCSSGWVLPVSTTS